MPTQAEIQTIIESNSNFDKLTKVQIEGKLDEGSPTYDVGFSSACTSFVIYSRAENDKTSDRFYNMVIRIAGHDGALCCGAILKIGRHCELEILDEQRRPFTTPGYRYKMVPHIGTPPYAGAEVIYGLKMEYHHVKPSMLACCMG